MKNDLLRLFNLLIILICLMAFISCDSKESAHLGEWKVSENEKNWSLILSEDETALLVLNNQVFGGKDFELDGKKYSLTYDIDYSKKPIWLDFFVKDESTGKVKMLFTIARFITETKMEVRFNFDNPELRLNAFDPNDLQNTGVFEKAGN